jgi:hypothetical protein
VPVALDPGRSGLSDAAPMLCSIESFRASVQTLVVVPRVGARPLFLRKE